MLKCVYVIFAIAITAKAEETKHTIYEENYKSDSSSDSETNNQQSFQFERESVKNEGDVLKKESEKYEENENYSESSSHSSSQSKSVRSYSYKKNDNKDGNPDDGECTPSCPKHERYSFCIQAECRPLNCSQYEKSIPCPRIDPKYCKKGCVCEENYLRNDEGKCIPETQCDLICGENELSSNCINGGCDAKNCSQLGKPVPCVKLAEGACIKGCICKKGYLRDPNGFCVEENQCGPKCPGDNEEWVPCINPCQRETCESINKTYICPINRRGPCRGACRCIQGYYRNSQGKCIPKKDCVSDCPEGEIYSKCPAVKCDAEFCPESRDSPLFCPIGIVCDKPRCVCAYNKHRDRKTGKCINTVDCSPFPCDGENEHYAPCEASCVPETCSTYLKKAKCPPFRIGIVVPCRPGCHCDKGFFRNSNGDCVDGEQCEKEDEEITRQKLIQGNGKFSGEFFYALSKEQEGSKIVSPFSIMFPMGQLSLVTTGTAFNELSNIINIKDKNQIRRAFKYLLKSLGSDTKVELDLANLVGADIKYPFKKTFEEDSKLVFNAESKNFDFGDGAETAQEINDWVNEKTRGNIEKIVGPDLFNELTRLVLANAVYFKGAWTKPFRKDATKDEDFYIAKDRKVKVQMMSQKGIFGYTESSLLNAKILELTYQGGNFSMVFFLPNEIDGWKELIYKLRDYNTFVEAIDALQSETVKVSIPSMKIETEVDLTKTLKEVNVTKIFDPNESSISGVLENDQDLYVSAAIHKAFLNLDEDGTEAGAANVLVAGIRSMALPPPLTFNFRADHPFLFYIMSNKRTVLFCGSFLN